AWIDVRPEVMARYNEAIQRDIASVAVWQADCNGYYRSPSGRVVTQWPHNMAEFRHRPQQPDAEGYEARAAARRARNGATGGGAGGGRRRGLGGRVGGVPGGASGIGLALGRRFGEEGMRVVLADVEAPTLEKAAGELAGAGIEAVPVVCDVRHPASVEALAEAALARFGRVHVVCNNAGVGSRSQGPVWEPPPHP